MSSKSKIRRKFLECYFLENGEDNIVNAEVVEQLMENGSLELNDGVEIQNLISADIVHEESLDAKKNILIMDIAPIIDPDNYKKYIHLAKEMDEVLKQIHGKMTFELCDLFKFQGSSNDELQNFTNNTVDVLKL